MSYSQQYLDYLKSSTWKARRLAALERTDYTCQLCGEHESLEVHHLTYERLGNEDPHDLIVICKSHHWMEHNKRELKKQVGPTPHIVKVCKKRKMLIDKVRRCEKREKNRGLKSARHNLWMHKKSCSVCIENRDVKKRASSQLILQ